MSFITLKHCNRMCHFFELRTTLYPKNADQILVPDLIWIGFTSKDQLLSITADGGFDLWSVPSMKRTAGVKGALKGGSHLGVNGFTHTPVNFSLSNDGKTLALFNGTGFSFYDIATATETGRTEDFMKAGGSTNFSGSAMSPDGSSTSAITSFASRNRSISHRTPASSFTLCRILRTRRPLVRGHRRRKSRSSISSSSSVRRNPSPSLIVR